MQGVHSPSCSHATYRLGAVQRAVTPARGCQHRNRNSNLGTRLAAGFTAMFATDKRHSALFASERGVDNGFQAPADAGGAVARICPSSLVHVLLVSTASSHPVEPPCRCPCAAAIRQGALLEALALAAAGGILPAF